MKINYHKIAKLLGKITFVFMFGSLGALWANYYLLPKMSDWPILARTNALKRFKENVTIINKTEQITVNEDSAINKIASSATSSIVKILSIPDTPVKSFAQITNIAKEGDGTVVTGDGLVVTYRSTILEKNAKYKVIASDRNSFDAELVGIDDFTNLAYLKISGSNFTSLPFSNSDDVVAGKRVIGIGLSGSDNQNRFFAGMINDYAKDFNISGEAVASSAKLEGVFRIDFGQAGMLGTPVISYNGELVGIAGGKILDGQTQFFLIPANRVKESMERYFRGELGMNPALGISYVSITRSFSLSHDLAEMSGALVYSPSGKQGLAILANSPAEKAGLRINDIIKKVGEQNIDLDHPLSNTINKFKIGEEVELTVLRNGSEIKIKVIL